MYMYCLLLQWAQIDNMLWPVGKLLTYVIWSPLLQARIKSYSSSMALVISILYHVQPLYIVVGCISWYAILIGRSISILYMMLIMRVVLDNLGLYMCSCVHVMQCRSRIGLRPRELLMNLTMMIINLRVTANWPDSWGTMLESTARPPATYATWRRWKLSELSPFSG